MSNSFHHMQPDMAPVTIVVERSATISGRVVDPEGAPVVGAAIVAVYLGTGRTRAGHSEGYARSGDDGAFEMNKPAGDGESFYLLAHDGWFKDFRKWANATSGQMSTQPGDEINDVQLRLAAPCTVSGRVVDVGG